MAPTPTPVPSDCLIPSEEGQIWSPAGPAASELKLHVRASQAAIGDVCGKPPVQSLELLAIHLRARGICAGRMSDSVFAQVESGLFEEWHAVYFQDGCWIANNAKGLWVREEGPQ